MVRLASRPNGGRQSTGLRAAVPKYRRGCPSRRDGTRTAPTGHTLLLLDATGSYHRQMLAVDAEPEASVRIVTL